MILITGGTGQVGGETARTLLRANADVRVLVRDPSRALGLDGAELVRGDFEDDHALGRALAGVETMFLAGRDSPSAVAHHRHVLRQAERAGVRHIVKLSAIGASRDSRVSLMRNHYEVDGLIENGPWKWTLLRPHLFMQNLLRAADSVRSGRIEAPMGDKRFPFVDTRDVAEAAAEVVAQPTPHAGSAYELTGPAALSYQEIAAALTRLSRHDVRYDAVAPTDYEALLISAGFPDWRAFDLAHIASAYNADQCVVSPQLAILLGRPPRSLDAFLADNAEAFQHKDSSVNS